MRHGLFTALMVMIIAAGAGLFAFARHLDPPFNSNDPVAVQHAMNFDAESHGVAAVATGLGVCLMTFGTLMIVLPWINSWIAPRRSTSESIQ